MVDGQSLQDVEQNLNSNLYKLWNRLSSGSDFPQAVKRVDIAKADGGTRPLGIPTVADRIAQMAVKMQREAELERHFHRDSYGDRPNKSAHQAVDQVKERCWDRAWVLDMDIQGVFDSLDHTLLLRAVDRHVKEDWQRLYIKRGLQVPVPHPDGRIEPKTQGTPQGGVNSPLLANLFLHYVFDKGVTKHCEGVQFVRYAEDIGCHCRTEQEAETLWALLKERLVQCGLTRHPEKTKIVYCKSWKHKADYARISLDFLGFTFRPRLTKCRDGILLVCFLPAMSRKAANRIRSEINSWPWLRWTQGGIKEIVAYSRSKLRGWMEYDGKYGRGVIHPVWFHFDKKLTCWAKRKYKKLRSAAQAMRRVSAFKGKNPRLFAHW